MKALPWVLLSAALAAGYLYLRRVERERAADLASALEAQHDAEEKALDEANVSAATLADRDRMAQELDAAVAGNEELRQALERAQRAIPKARVVEVEHTSTGPTPAAVDVHQGDSIDLRVSEIELKTEAGTVAAVGTAEVVLVPSEVVVARAELRGSYLLEPPAPPPDSGWPTWAVAVAGVAGAAAGAGLVLLAR